MEARICKKCQKEKMIEDMHSTKNYKGERRYWFTCRDCYNNRCNAYHKTPAGLVAKIYNAQKRASKKRNMDAPAYSYQELLVWMQAQPNFKTLFDNWVASGFKSRQRPSIDRLDDYLPYFFENIRLVTWDENMFKNHEGCRMGNNKMAEAMCNPVVQLSINGDYINSFLSTAIASRFTNTNPSSIKKVVNGNLKMAGGFVWISKRDYDKNPNLYHKQYDVHKKRVVQLTMDKVFINEYDSLKSAVVSIGRGGHSIEAVLRRNGKSAAGYFWMYAKDYYESIC